MANTTTEWAVYYETKIRNARVVAHLYITAETEEEALEAGRKEIGSNDKVVHVDRAPEWSVGVTEKADVVAINRPLPRDPDYVQETWDKGTVEERIHHLRRIVLVHSILYYHLDANIVPDAVFDRWSYELARLQKENPKASERVAYHLEGFRDYDGSGGSQLPLRDVRALNNALRLYNSRTVV
jgi:hypothetical protein